MAKIGWIGTGVMGRWMAGHVLGAGYNLSVFNIPKERTDPLVSSGAIFRDPREIAQSCDIVMTMVGFHHELRELVLGNEGILQYMKKDSILVDHTTSSPTLSAQIAETASQRGVWAFDAPVSGGDQGARDAKLAIFVGGDKGKFSTIEPILTKYGANVQHVGRPGEGQHTKLTNQIALCGVMIGMVEAFVYGHKAGLNLTQMADLVGSGAAGSMYFRAMSPKLVKGDHDPGFYVKHMVKDIGLILDECKLMNLTLPGLSLVNEFYRSLIAHGEENLGAHALIKVIERLNNHRITN